MKIQTVTITGADDNTNIGSIIEISKKYPFVEWGILFSPTRNKNSEPRYPSKEWVLAFCPAAIVNDMKASAHICGGYTREMLTEGTFYELWGDLFHKQHIQNTFKRAQLNFNATKHIGHPNPTDNVVKSINKLTSLVDGISVILQYNKSNQIVCDSIRQIPMNPYKPWINFLYDGSGGRGVSPIEWKPAIQDYFTGYSGGLNPDNIREHIHSIEKVVDEDFFAKNRLEIDAGKLSSHTKIWIDVESGVRTDDKLDLEKVVKFLEIAKLYI